MYSWRKKHKRKGKRKQVAIAENIIYVRYQMQAAFIIDYQHYALLFSLYSKLRTDSMAL